MLKPKYAMNIIVGVQCYKQFSWYVSDIMDSNWLLSMEYEDKNFDTIDWSLTREKFYELRPAGIVTVNKTNAKKYLASLEHEKATASELKKMLKDAEDLDDFVPSLYVDFDHKIFCDNYPELGAFDTHIPKGWKCSYEVKWMADIPQEEQYWMENGKNLLLEERK